MTSTQLVCIIPNEKSIKQVDADEEIRVDTTRGYWARNKNPVFHPRAKEILIQPGKDLPREPEIFNNRNRHVLLNTRPQGKLYSNILRPKLTSSTRIVEENKEEPVETKISSSDSTQMDSNSSPIMDSKEENERANYFC